MSGTMDAEYEAAMEIMQLRIDYLQGTVDRLSTAQSNGTKPDLNPNPYSAKPFFAPIQLPEMKEAGKLFAEISATLLEINKSSNKVVDRIELGLEGKPKRGSQAYKNLMKDVAELQHLCVWHDKAKRSAEMCASLAMGSSEFIYADGEEE